MELGNESSREGGGGERDKWWTMERAEGVSWGWEGDQENEYPRRQDWERLSSAAQVSGVWSCPVDVATKRPRGDSGEQLGRERSKNEFTPEGSVGREEQTLRWAFG